QKRAREANRGKHGRPVPARKLVAQGHGAIAGQMGVQQPVQRVDGPGGECKGQDRGPANVHVKASGKQRLPEQRYHRRIQAEYVYPIPTAKGRRCCRSGGWFVCQETTRCAWYLRLHWKRVNSFRLAILFRSTGGLRVRLR